MKATIKVGDSNPYLQTHRDERAMALTSRKPTLSEMRRPLDVVWTGPPRTTFAGQTDGQKHIVGAFVPKRHDISDGLLGQAIIHRLTAV